VAEKTIAERAAEKLKDLAGYRKCVECGKNASKAGEGEVDGIRFDLYICSEPNAGMPFNVVPKCHFSAFAVRRDTGHLVAPAWLRRLEKPLGIDKIREYVATFIRDLEWDRRRKQSLKDIEVVCSNPVCERRNIEARNETGRTDHYCFECGHENKRRGDIAKEGGR
jgi:hypothetical protein